MVRVQVPQLRPFGTARRASLNERYPRHPSPLTFAARWPRFRFPIPRGKTTCGFKPFMSFLAVILAAGQGVRLNSSTPKVLHRLAGKPLVRYAIETARTVTGQTPVLVVGHGAEAVRAEVGPEALYAVQEQQLGTGHAVLQAAALAHGQASRILVTYADMPLLRPETVRALADMHAATRSAITLLTADAPEWRDFGRIVRDENGDVRAIVEAAQATPEQFAMTEVNVGVYCFHADWLWNALPRLPLSPKGEYYLTDAIALAVSEGRRVTAVTTHDLDETLGINTRAQLAQAEAALRRRVNAHWMSAGVTLADPATTYIEPNVRLGRDVLILPNTHLQGNTVIGDQCVIGPNCLIRDTTLGQACQITFSVLEEAWLADHVEVGPFAHLRRGARLETGVHMGNFGEVKNSTLGPGSKMGHFSYLGDAVLGANVNVGAGTITCNYDGTHKHPTHVGDNVFIGSDTMLVAPVTLGAGARTGAGAVVTHDVPDHTLVVGVPARPVPPR